ncbi:MAG TPA: phospholipid carrier-dependent glycosyltransferase [Anaerolineales bacterium]|nr:phospholipid carrier-dependent glycosyltransferase [Anaerolineales bacterium]
MKIRLSPHLASFLTLSLLIVIGIFLVLRSTPEGLGLSDDSVAYIAGARSLLAGRGYREAWLVSDNPITHFPPGFSSALAFIGLFGLDPLRGARFLNALLYGLSTGLIGILGWRMTRSLAPGLVLAGLFVSNGSLLQVYTTAMSEPLFIFLSLLAFWMFDLYFERDKHWLWLVLCGAFVGAAYLTRYAGLALVATFLVALAILHDTWRRRWVSAGIFLAGVLPWIAGWSIRNLIAAGNVANRELVWHPITANNFDTTLYTISQFLVPVEGWRKQLYKTPWLFTALAAWILLIALVWLIRRAWKYFVAHPPASYSETISFTTGLYLFGYIASILSSMLLFDASTKFKLRILAPIFISLLILLVLLGVWLWRKRRELAVLFALLVIGLSIYNQLATLQELSKGGQGFASFVWYNSKAMAYLRTLPRTVRIYTNETGAVYLYTDRPTYSLPNRFDPVTAQPRSGYEQGVAQMHQQVLAGKAVLAIFAGGEQSAGPDAAFLVQGLYPASKSGTGVVYAAAP